MKILQQTKCDIEGCECGWNITIGGQETEDLEGLLEYIRKERGYGYITEEEHDI